MKYNSALIIAAMFFVSNAHAGWFDNLFGDGDKVIEKLESVEKIANQADVTSGIKSALSNDDIAVGLKEALNKGAGFAVANLGKAGGFLDNAEVKIPLPERLEKVESLLRKTGNDKYTDEFVTTMNRAAEAAVPLTLNIIKQSVADMSIEDAKNILGGADNAATQYLKKSGGDKLSSQILPIVQDATAKAGVTGVYKKMYDKLGFAGKVLNLDDYNIDSYVTKKTTEGLFTMIALEEKRIRENPAERTTEILKSVFGAD